jgi:ABC-2 type transport system permease protein
VNGRTIRALLKKDTALFRSNRFYLLMTVVGLIFYIGMYFVLPRTVEETLKLAMYAPAPPPAFSQLTQQPGAEIKQFDTEDALKQAVLKGGYTAGLALPSDMMAVWAAGGKPQVTVYYPSSSPPEVADAIAALVKELAYAQTGQALAFDVNAETLGPDMLGTQVPLRDRMVPMMAIFILLLEIMSLASLITVEIEQGTARALLVTPMGISDLFAAKGILGGVLALAQAVLFMLLVGGFSHQPLLMLVTLLAGCLFAVGTGFLVASLARDVMAVTGLSLLIFVILAIPGFGSIVPGLLSGWAKAIPSYYLTDTVNRIANYGAGWGDVALNLAIISGISILFLGLGMISLRRRYQ